MLHSNDNHKEMPTPANSLPVGTRMHEYKIKAVIGAGGFGVVYLADDTLLGREVAIKEYLPVSHAKRIDQYQVQARTPEQQGLFEKGLKSFVAEARILAQFRNSNLVEVMRFWEGNGTAYIVMPYYRGKTLRDLIQAGFRASDKASLCDILLPLLKGLEQVHAVGCFHRDISPDNIVLLPDGTPLLLDFGAARHEIISEADASTVILKPGFAPIEQYGGKETASQQGPWTDIYALCAVAYQLITGNMPPSSVARMMRDPLVPLGEQASSYKIPLHMLKAIDSGLQVQPQARPQSIAEFMALLHATEPAFTHASDEDRVHQQPLMGAAAAAATSPDSKPTATTKKVRSTTMIALVGLGTFLAAAAVLYWLAVPPNTAVVTVTNQQTLPTNPVYVPEAVIDNTVRTPSTETVITPQQADIPVIAPAIPTHAQDTALDNAIPQLEFNDQNLPLSVSVNEEIIPLHTETAQDSSAAPEVNDSTVVQPQEQVAEEVVPPNVGRLIVQVQPWGDVYLNGTLVGTAPPSIRLQVPAGTNTIEIRNDSAPAYTQTLTVEAGKTVRLSHNFTP